MPALIDVRIHFMHVSLHMVPFASCMHKWHTFQKEVLRKKLLHESRTFQDNA